MPKEIERPLPQNPDAERSVLGGILVNNAMLDTAMEKLKPAHFFQDGHQRIFGRMIEMGSEQCPIDLVTLVDRLGRAGELEAVGGAGYVASLEDGVPHISNVGYYARIVLETYAMRRVIHLAHAMWERAFSSSVAEAAEVMESTTRALVDLSAETSLETDGVTELEAATTMLAYLEKNDGPRVLSGVSDLDDFTGGALAGELWAVCAGTGVGKTLWARQVSDFTCKRGWHTLYASGEMFAHHLASKRVFPDADVNPIKYRFPERIAPAERTALIKASSAQCKECRILDGELSLSRMRTAARKMSKETKLGQVVGDYDALINSPGSSALDRQISLVRGVKQIGMECGCAATLISQLRKLLAPGEEPGLDDVFGSKMAVAHATAVLYVSRRYVERLEGDETTAQIVVMKFRDGRIGRIPARFNVPKLRFENAPPSETDSVPEKPVRRAKRGEGQKELL